MRVGYVRDIIKLGIVIELSKFSSKVFKYNLGGGVGYVKPKERKKNCALIYLVQTKYKVPTSSHLYATNFGYYVGFKKQSSAPGHTIRYVITKILTHTHAKILYKNACINLCNFSHNCDNFQ